MSQNVFFPERSLRVSYWNADPRVVDKDLMALEKYLKELGSTALTNLKSLDDISKSPLDLLLVGAQMIPEAGFVAWFGKLKERVVKQASIWCPTLIVCDISMGVQRELFFTAVHDNWYFDLLAPDHLSSLPIRVANLLKIHDHLHELRRYSETLSELQKKLDSIEASNKG